MIIPSLLDIFPYLSISLHFLFFFFTFFPFILPCMCVREQGLCNPCCCPFIYIYVCMYMYIMYVTKKSLSVTLVSTHISTVDFLSSFSVSNIRCRLLVQFIPLHTPKCYLHVQMKDFLFNVHLPLFV